MYLDGNLLRNVDENLDGNVNGNFDSWNFGSLEIQYANLVWKFRWKFSLENQLEIQIEIQMEFFILGILDPQKFSMEVQFGNLDGNLVWKISWKFRQKLRWNFLSLEF